VKVICAPDSFKGSVTARAAAEAMAAGIRQVVPDAIIDCCPIADGGEGTLDALTSAIPLERHRATVNGPLGERTEALFGLSGDGQLAVVESAAAIGLGLVPEHARNPEVTSSYGVGELIRRACHAGPRKIIVAVGGSASNDGGCGMAQALGIRFYDAKGKLIEQPLCGGKLLELSRIDASQRLPELGNIEVLAACDVGNPLTGPQGAARVYAVQKGATGPQVARLDKGLAHLSSLIRRDLDIAVDELPGSGAGGGLGGGLVAFTGAMIASGIDTVLEAVDFDRRVRSCDLCLTGEGRIDGQSVFGKACMGVATAADRHGVPTIALTGTAGPGAEQCLQAGLKDYIVIGDGLPLELSMQQADALIAEAAGRVAATFLRNAPA
jgi:glycerate kinase